MKFLLLFIPFLVFGLVCSCDETLYIKANGIICQGERCGDDLIIAFPIQTGKSTCFRDVNNDIITIHIRNTYDRIKYNHIYDTSDFDVKMETESFCSTDCDPNTCGLNKKYDGFVEKIDRIQGYTCEIKSICNQYCFSGERCTYMHWWLEPKGNISKVYQFSSKHWEVNIDMNYKGTNKSITLNLNDPSFRLNDINFAGIDNNFSILINSFLSEIRYVNKHLIEDNMNFFHIDGSELNFPNVDKIGDYQITIDRNKNTTYNVKHVRCEANFCNKFCSAPEPALKRFRGLKNQMEKLQFYEIKRNGHVIEEKSMIFATLFLKIGNVDIASANIVKGVCNILDNVSGFGCTDCNLKPYLIFEANKIQKEGIIPFQSNCTFNKDYLSCATEPYILHVNEINSYCYIYMPSINQTIYIDTNIFFLTSKYVQETPWAIAKNIFISWEFAYGLISTMTGVTIFGVLILIFTKILQVYLPREEIRTIQKQEI